MSRLTLSKAFRIAGVALALVVGTGPAFAQMPYGQERARAVGELTHDGIATALREDGRVSMSGGFFEFDSAELTGTSGQILFKLSKALESVPELRVVIVGHTDSSGTFEYNLELSRKRADAVRTALLAEPYNVEPDRMVALGVGQIAPVVSNLSDEGRALNRRVEFVVLTE